MEGLVETLRRFDVLVPIGRRLDPVERERRAELDALTSRPHCLRREPGGEIQVVRRRAARIETSDAGRVRSDQMTEHGDDAGLVQEDEMAGAIADALDHRRRVVGESPGGVASGPAAAILERLRQVPVVETRPRLDAGFEQRIDQPIVEVEATRS